MKKIIWLVTAATVLAAAPVSAQEEAAAPNGVTAVRDGVLSYDASWFEGSNPNTAQDMANRLPGFRVDDGQPVRGFAGAGGNVLINGSRPASKIETVSSALGRIPASRVERIELIRGGAGGVDMQGRSVVANVILRREPSRQHTLTGQAYLFEGGPSLPGGRYEFSSTGNDSEWGFQIGRTISMSDSTGTGEQVRRGPDGEFLLREDVSNKFDGGGWSGGANWAGRVGEGRLEVRASLSDWDYEDYLIFRDDADERRFDFRQDSTSGDISLRYERPLTERMDLETRLIQNLGRQELVNSGLANGSEQRFNSERDTAETIGRAVINWRRSDDLRFESGGELVYNVLDTAQSFAVDGVPVELPLATTKVEELRGEIFSQAVWRRSDTLSLEAGARLEHSTIRQSGDASAERSFFYPKPRLAATWDPAENHQVRLRFERELGQLNFEDFAASSSLSNDQVLGGNIDLRPQQRWISEAVYERRFMDDGVLTLTYRHDEIVDVVDVIPLDEGLTAIGNIGDGSLDRLRAEVRLPLRALGLERGRITGHVQYDHTRVTDPTTGEDRSISRVRPLTGQVRFENDVPDWNLTWGALWIPYFKDTTYNPDQTRYFELRNYTVLFGEYTFGGGLSVLAELTVWDDFRIGRDVFATRDPRTLAFTERQELDPRDFLRLRVRKTF
ncbi:TonB-dependent receptor [Glycocaulis profundi]|nr:TonB-dependent receptor [Glycocaulis profundi]